MSTNPDASDTVQTVDAKGTPSKSRFANATNCWNVFQKCLNDDATAAEKRSRIQGLIDGNPPYDAKKLEALGQSWRANVNYREAESIRDSNSSAYWSLVTEVPTLITCSVREKKGDVPWQRENWGQIIAEELTDLMMEWDDFYFNFMQHVGEMLTFGLGPVVWTDKFDWRFEALQHANILIPPRTKSTIGKVTLFFIRDTISIFDLFTAIEDPKIAKEMGWNVKEVRDVIIERWNKGRLLDSEKYSKSQWESFQQMVKNNDVWQDYDDMDGLKIVHCYTKEVKSGKISHRIMPEVDARKKFMYEACDEYADMAQVFSPFIFNIGDGFMRSVKGIGHRMYQSIELSNRLINTTFDGAMLGASLIVNSNGSKKDMRLMRMGPVTQLPEGITPIQTSFVPNLNGIIMARGMLSSLLHNNHGVKPISTDTNDMPRRTRAEVMIAEQKEAKLLNYQIAQYYTHWDRVYREILRRLFSSGYPTGHRGYQGKKDFIQRLKDRGVPAEAMDVKRLKVKAFRAIGAGSQSVRQQITKQILEGSAMYDSRGKQNAVRDWLASLGGYDAADRYSPIANRDQIATTEHTLAAVENAVIADGKPIPVGVDQLHNIHLMVHMPQLMELVTQIMKAMDAGQDINPQAVLPALEQWLPHVIEHLQLLAGDPRNKEAVQQYTAAIKQAGVLMQDLDAMAKQNDQARQQAMQENAQTLMQAQAAIQSDDLKVKLARVQAEFQVRLQDASNKARIKEMTAKHNMMLKQMMAEAKIQAIQQKTEGEPG